MSWRLTSVVIISLVWATLGVFVARKGWEVARVVFVVFQPAVRGPKCVVGLPGWQWPVVSEKFAMVGGVNYIVCTSSYVGFIVLF